MATRHVIEKEMRSLGVITRKKGEADADFLERAARACDKFEWDKLPESVQAWANEAMGAVVAKTDIPNFGDVVYESQAPKDETPAASEEKEEPMAAKPTKKAVKTAAKKTKATKAAKPPKAEKVRKGPAFNAKKGDNAHDQFRQLVIDNPTATRAELYAMAEKSGCALKMPSMSACIYHVDATLKALAARGFTVPEAARARSRNAAAKAARDEKRAADKAAKAAAREEAKAAKASKKTTRRKTTKKAK